MIELCELDVPRQQLVECPRCTEIFFRRVSRIQIGPLTIVVIRRYLLRKCYVGLALGQHVHSLTLLPGEELEIEIVRRSKFSRALHEQRSVESEFRFELQSTTRDEWTSEEESNFKITADEDFEIFGIGVKSTQEYSTREKTAETHFSEIVAKTSSRVSRKYEVSVDTKTEVENQYRSVRKIKNPNPCQPVIYNYFQLAKKYKTELILTDLRFDFIRQPPPILTGRLGVFVIGAETPYRQNLNLQVVAPPPPWRLAAPAAAPSPTGASPLVAPTLAPFAAFQALGQPFAPAAVRIAGLPAERPPAEPSDVMQLTHEELLQKISSDPDIPEKTVTEFKRVFDGFLKDDLNKLGVKATYEYCVNTDGLYVEANVSKCSACDEATIELRRLEVEKAKAELEQKKGGS